MFGLRGGTLRLAASGVDVWVGRVAWAGAKGGRSSSRRRRRSRRGWLGGESGGWRSRPTRQLLWAVGAHGSWCAGAALRDARAPVLSGLGPRPVWRSQRIRQPRRLATTFRGASRRSRISRDAARRRLEAGLARPRGIAVTHATRDALEGSGSCVVRSGLGSGTDVGTFSRCRAETASGRGAQRGCSEAGESGIAWMRVWDRWARIGVPRARRFGAAASMRGRLGACRGCGLVRPAAIGGAAFPGVPRERLGS